MTAQNPFGPEARARRRLARIQRFAGAFATSPTLPGNDSEDGPLDRRRLPTAAIKLANEFLGQFTWPIIPTLVYRGIRTATRDEQTPAIEADAHVILSAQIVTLTGCRREVDVPVVVRRGELLEPSVMIVDGVPRIISQSLVDEVVRQGTFKQKVDPRGGMFAPPLDREGYDAFVDLDEAFKIQDRYSRGLYSVAGRRTAQEKPYREKPFRLGDRVTVDGDEAVVKECYPDGSSSYMFPHCKVDFIDGDRNVAVPLDRVQKKAGKTAQSQLDEQTIHILQQLVQFGPWTPRGPGEAIGPEYLQPLVDQGLVEVAGKTVTITDAGRAAVEGQASLLAARMARGDVQGRCKVCGYMAAEPEFGEPPACPACQSPEIGWGMQAQRSDRDEPACPQCGGWLEGGRRPDGKDCPRCGEFVRNEDIKQWSPDTKYPASDAPGFEDAPDWDDVRPRTGQSSLGDPKIRTAGGYEEDEIALLEAMPVEQLVLVLSEWQRMKDPQAAEFIETIEDILKSKGYQPGHKDASRTAQRYEPGARVKVSGDPARVLEQVHEPTGNGAWDGSYRVEWLDGHTDVVPESKLSVDRDQETLRHVEAWSPDPEFNPDYDFKCPACQKVYWWDGEESGSTVPADGVCSCGEQLRGEDGELFKGAQSSSIPKPDPMYGTNEAWQQYYERVREQEARQVECESCGEKGEWPLSGSDLRLCPECVNDEIDIRHPEPAAAPDDDDVPDDIDQLVMEPNVTCACGSSAFEVGTDGLVCAACGAPMAKQAQAGGSWPMPGEDVLQTPTGRWQWIFDADTKRARYYHLECDGYAGQDGDCELCGAPSPSSPRYVTTGKGTYGPRSGAREGDGMPAEHNRSRREDDFLAGQAVTFSRSFRERTRGGPSYLVESGASGRVIRDVFEDGTSFEVEVDGRKVVVPRETLKRSGRRADVIEYPPDGREFRCRKCGATHPVNRLVSAEIVDGPTTVACPACYSVDLDRIARATVDQVVREVEALKQEGYDDIDAMLAVHQKYPDLADAVMQAARDKGLLDLDGEQ